MENATVNTRMFLSTISEEEDILFGIIYTLFGILSLVGNSVLLFVAYRKRQILKPAEYFVANLAVSDISMTVTLLPLAISSNFSHRWLFGQQACMYYGFCSMLFGICSLTNLTVLSTVCCMKVCFPAYGNRFTPEHARLLIGCVWGYASIFAISPLAEWGQYGPEPYGTACCIKWAAADTESKAVSYIIALFVFCYIFPSVIIIASYALILLTVKGSRRAVQQHMSAQTNTSNIHSLIVKMSVAVCIGFLIAWTPYAFIAMWAVFGSTESVPPLAFALAAAFAKSSTLYNPLIYLLFKPNFRKLLSKDIAKLYKLCREPCRCCDISPASARNRSSLTSSKVPNGLEDGHSTYKTCTDTFECFSNYPRCQQKALGSAEFTSKGSAVTSSNNSGRHGSTKKNTRVLLTESPRYQTESTEVTINALPTSITRDRI
ncbi:opsin-5-like [Callorhinchus milii]|uniref:opsin-5-like n=1 Tax=Callorhinchus milii TaxID=7868 RepID=UPI001C3F8C2A|nr:opsin-5-like [Callorhinchus milii]